MQITELKRQILGPRKVYVMSEILFSIWFAVDVLMLFSVIMALQLVSN